MDKSTSTCPVCELVAPEDTHPCRFAKACRCWYGEPCKARIPVLPIS